MSFNITRCTIITPATGKSASYDHPSNHRSVGPYEKNQWHHNKHQRLHARPFSLGRQQWNCSEDSICGSKLRQPTQPGANKKVSVTDVGPGWWYWAAVNYIVLLQLPIRSQLSFPASLSPKLAVPLTIFCPALCLGMFRNDAVCCLLDLGLNLKEVGCKYVTPPQSQ